MRAAPAGDQPFDELAGGPLPGLPGVLVRGEAVRGEQVEGFGEAARDIAVQIHGGRYQRVGSRRGPHRLGQIRLRVDQADHAHRAVDVVHQAVQRPRLADQTGQFRLDAVIRGPFDGTAGQRDGVHQRHPLDPLGEAVVRPRPRVAVQQRTLPGDTEIVVRGAVRAELAGLDGHTADADAQAAAGGGGHGGSLSVGGGRRGRPAGGGAGRRWGCAGQARGAGSGPPAAGSGPSAAADARRAAWPAPSSPASGPQVAASMTRSLVAIGRQRS